MIEDIKTIESEKILLVGYHGNTKKGFSIIGKCMRKLEVHKDMIANRSESDCFIALNEYTLFPI